MGGHGRMRKQTLPILKFTVRWGIAVFGIWYVVSKMSWHDRIWAVPPGESAPQWMTVVGETAQETDNAFQVIDPRNGAIIAHEEVVARPDHPRLEIGVIRMVRQAEPKWLFAALAIFPLTILITSFRWHELLKAVDIRLTMSRTFVLNMVGLFYSTFMLGS